MSELSSFPIESKMAMSRANLLPPKGTRMKKRGRLRKAILLAPTSPLLTLSRTPSPTSSSLDSQGQQHNTVSKNLRNEEKDRIAVRAACVSCRSRHLKCDGLNPCTRCSSNHVSCVYIRIRQGLKKPSPEPWFDQFAKRQTSKKEQQMEFERAKEREVNAAWESFKGAHKYAAKKWRSIPMPPIINREFELFSSDHVSKFYAHSWNTLIYMPKTINFRPPDKDECKELLRNGVKQVDRPIFAQVHLYDFESEAFGPFLLPMHATLDTLQIRSSDDSRSVLWLQIFGDRYLKIRVSRDLVYHPDVVSSSNSPKMFGFVGILKVLEKVAVEETLAENQVTVFQHEEAHLMRAEDVQVRMKLSGCGKQEEAQGRMGRLGGAGAGEGLGGEPSRVAEKDGVEAPDGVVV